MTLEGPIERPEELAVRLLQLAGRLADESAKVGQLAVALEGRDVIGQAKGILMERHGVDADEAFRMLHDVSNDTNTKLSDIAAVLARTGKVEGL